MLLAILKEPQVNGNLWKQMRERAMSKALLNWEMDQKKKASGCT